MTHICISKRTNIDSDDGLTPGRRQAIIWTNTGILLIRPMAMASQITSVSIVSSTVCSGVDHRKHQSSAPLAFVRGIRRWPVNSPHKGPVTRKIFPFDDVIIYPFPKTKASTRYKSYRVCAKNLPTFSQTWNLHDDDKMILAIEFQKRD